MIKMKNRQSRFGLTTPTYGLAACLFLLQLSVPGSLVVGQDAAPETLETPEAQETPETSEAASSILDDPYDFSAPPTLPKVEPISEGQIYSAIDRGVRFLIEDQNSNGSWGSPTRTKGLNIYAPVPGAHHAFRAATTSLGIMAQ